MTKEKTLRKGPATKKAAPEKKHVSSKSKPARARTGSRKKTSSSTAQKTKKTTSVKKSSSSKSTANAKKTGTKSGAGKKTAAKAKKTVAAEKKAGTGKKKAPAAKKIPAATTKSAPASAKKTTSKQTRAKVIGSTGTAKSPKDNKTSGEKSTASRRLVAKSRPIAFSLDEARHIARTRASASARKAPKTQAPNTPAAKAKKGEMPQETKPTARVLGAASLADILGRTPGTSTNPVENLKKEVPKKHHRYLELLKDLREHVLSELDLHTKDTLKRSSKEDSGNLSGYGQHMADAGTDSFDRDFALSLVSTEQEALSEIEAAIERIHKGTYGVCEITGKPIAKERLLAVPFARYSIEGQVEYEKTKRRPSQRGGAYLDSGSDGGDFLTEDSEE